MPLKRSVKKRRIRQVDYKVFTGGVHNDILYGNAQNLGRVLCKAYDEALQKYDVLILPTLPKKAPAFPPENPPLEGGDFLKAVTNVLKFAVTGCSNTKIPGVFL